MVASDLGILTMIFMQLKQRREMKENNQFYIVVIILPQLYHKLFIGYDDIVFYVNKI